MLSSRSTPTSAAQLGTASGLFRTFGYVGSIASSAMIGVVFHNGVSDGKLHLIGAIMTGRQFRRARANANGSRAPFDIIVRAVARRGGETGFVEGHRMNENLASIDPDETALLVMDYEPAILGMVSDSQALLARAAEAIRTMRTGAAVAYVRVAFDGADYAAVPPRNGAGRSRSRSDDTRLSHRQGVSDASARRARRGSRCALLVTLRTRVSNAPFNFRRIVIV